jgi:uncharacterized protein (DUF433 family)
MNETKSYVRTDEHGVMRVGATRVSLDSVVYPFLDGRSAEAIQEEYPALSLEEVYGAITFYLANREAVHQYLQRQEQLWKELRERAEQSPSPVVDRLRRLRGVAAKDHE